MRLSSTVVTALTATACISAAEDAPTTPEIFEAGVVSTAAPEFGITFGAEGHTLYFNRTSVDRSRITMMESRLVDGRWTAPSPVGFSGPSRDLDPFVSPDGTHLYFSSDRPTSATDSIHDFNTWFVELSAGGHGEPQLLPEPLNTQATEVFASVTRAGAIFFSSDRDGVLRIYRGVLTDLEAPVELVSVDLNTGETGAGNPLVAPDEQFLLFTATGATAGDESDVYMTRRADGGWLPAERLGGAVNSPFADFAPALSPDGRLLYFTSERPGVVPGTPAGERPPGDIYHVVVDFEAAGPLPQR
jgi:Tol biopolymer transport system component